MKNKEYIIYFEIFGKKMKTIITASNKPQAKELLIKKIIFHKIIINNDQKIKDIDDTMSDDFIKGDDELNNLMNMFGMKK